MQVPLRTRRRRSLCRAGWILCLLLVLIWAIGNLRGVTYVKDNWGVGYIGGHLVVAWLPFPIPPPLAQIGFTAEWDAGMGLEREDMLLWPHIWYSDFDRGDFVGSFPLWLPVLALATVLTVFDRRTKAVLAERRCKYCFGDLAANNRRACTRCFWLVLLARLAVLLLTIRLGLAVDHEIDTAAWVALPWACVVACWLVIPSLLRLWYRRRLSQLLLGYCACCGYNLTGNVSGVCSECGTPLQTAAA